MEEMDTTEAVVKAEAEEVPASGHTCGVCSRSFPLLSSLSQHMRSHTLVKPYKCPHCEHRTAQKGSLKAHVRGHKLGLIPHNLLDVDEEAAKEPCKSPETPEPAEAKPEAPAAASDAGKRKGTKRRLSETDLMEIDGEGDGGSGSGDGGGGGGGGTCIICGDTFPQTLLLKTHMKVHDGREDFSCRICGRRFRQSWFLQSHVQSHRTKVKRKCESPATINGVPVEPSSLVNEVCLYELCGVCGNFFADRAALQAHERLHNPGPPKPDPPRQEEDADAAKISFMAALNLRSVHDTSHVRPVPQLNPYYSAQALMLARKGRLLRPRKRPPAEPEKAKNAQPRPPRKKKQDAGAESKAAPDPKAKPKTQEPKAKGRNKRASNSSALNGLGQAFYEELHNRKFKGKPAAGRGGVEPGLRRFTRADPCPLWSCRREGLLLPALRLPHRRRRRPQVPPAPASPGPPPEVRRRARRPQPRRP